MRYEALVKELYSLMCRRPEDGIPPFPPNGFRGQFILLRCLYDANGVMFAGDLAQKLCVTSGRIATAIKRLEAMGLVTKQKSDADGRRTAVILTDAGREALLNHEAQVQGFLLQRLSRLTEEEASEYIRLTRKMR